MSRREYCKQGTHCVELDGTIHWGGERSGRMVVGLDDTIQWTTEIGGGSGDLPAEKDVVYPTIYDNGLKQGTFGFYDPSDADIFSQIRDAIDDEILKVLPDFKPLAYLLDIEKNDFRRNKKRYGTLINESEQTNEIVGRQVIDQDYTITLTDGYVNKNGNDKAARAKIGELREKINLVYKRLVATKAGLVDSVILVTDLETDVPQVNDEDNVIAMNMTFTVKVKLN